MADDGSIDPGSDGPPEGSAPTPAAGVATGAHRGSGRGRTDVVLLTLRGIGQTLITAGLVILLFVVYEVWVTNWFSDRENHKLQTKLEKQWAAGQDPLALPGTSSKTLKTGIGIANL